jgi:hypothetical protein
MRYLVIVNSIGTVFSDEVPEELKDASNEEILQAGGKAIKENHSIIHSGSVIPCNHIVEIYIAET